MIPPFTDTWQAEPNDGMNRQYSVLFNMTDGPGKNTKGHGVGVSFIKLYAVKEGHTPAEVCGPPFGRKIKRGVVAKGFYLDDDDNAYEILSEAGFYNKTTYITKTWPGMYYRYNFCEECEELVGAVPALQAGPNRVKH